LKFYRTLADNPESAAAALPRSHDHAHAATTTRTARSEPGVYRELVIDVSAEEVAKAYRAVAGNYRKYAKIPGFRAGKVPETIVRRRFAAEIRKK